MPKSVLEAIKLGVWDFEPAEVEFSQFAASDAMPGTAEKLRAIEERARAAVCRSGTRRIATTWKRPPGRMASDDTRIER